MKRVLDVSRVHPTFSVGFAAAEAAVKGRHGFCQSERRAAFALVQYVSREVAWRPDFHGADSLLSSLQTHQRPDSQEGFLRPFSLSNQPNPTLFFRPNLRPTHPIWPSLPTFVTEE